MKIYSYPNKKNINTYFVVDENKKEGVVINPVRVQQHLIKKIEDQSISLIGCLATNHNIKEINNGIIALRKIYKFEVFSDKNMIQKMGVATPNIQLFSHYVFNIASLRIECFPIKFHHENVYMYKIGRALFSGLILLDFLLPPYELSSTEKQSRKEIEDIFLSLNGDTLLFCLSGPPTTIRTLKLHISSQNKLNIK